MANKFLDAIFARDDEDGVDGDGDESAAAAGAIGRPRSIADAWERLADQNARLEKRLAAVEAAHTKQIEVAELLQENAEKQLETLKLLGRFHEAAEKRGREMEAQFRGVPDVLRTLPSATREQAERLSEIAARLYEKAQDNTVNALKSAQANHQRAIEDLIDESLGASRKLTTWAMLLVVAAGVLCVVMWMQTQG